MGQAEVGFGLVELGLGNGLAFSKLSQATLVSLGFFELSLGLDHLGHLVFEFECAAFWVDLEDYVLDSDDDHETARLSPSDLVEPKPRDLQKMLLAANLAVRNRSTQSP